jgi:transposase
LLKLFKKQQNQLEEEIQMKMYGAIDLHSNNNVVTITDEHDRVVFEKRLRNDLAIVLKHLSPYQKEITAIAVESTYNWYWLVDGLMDAGYNVKLVNTSAVAVYSGLKYTSDEHDARHLAHLLRLGLLPEGYICPKPLRAVRDLLRKRSQLVRYRTMQILSIQNLWSRNTGASLSAYQIKQLGEADVTQIFGAGSERTIAIQSNLAVLKSLQEQILRLEKRVLERVKLRPEYEKLLTVDGVGKILALTIMLETGEIKRFAKVGHYASYCRCVSSSRWSNAKKKGEGNRKNGNKYLAWAYVEAAHFAARSSERIRRFYQRKKSQMNVIIAVKATAHKLARACYYVMRDQVPFNVERAFN